MCCLIAALGLFGPRIALVLTWIFGDKVQIAFHNGWLVPLLGLLILPWTTLAYVLAFAPVRGVTSAGWLLVALGVLLDIGSYTSGGRYQRSRA
jgi:hypothetical protein